MKVETLWKIISNCRLSLEDEKVTQKELQDIFLSKEFQFEREFHLDKKNIIDFYFKEEKIGIEIKIGGISRANIYKQIIRYCEFEQINHIILLTNKSMALPAVINNKNTTIINLGEAWI